MYTKAFCCLSGVAISLFFAVRPAIADASIAHPLRDTIAREVDGRIGGFRDSGPCSIRVAAGQSIQAALNQANPGDVICVSPGIYNESLVMERSGTADAPIVIRGAGRRTVIDGGYVLPEGKPLFFFAGPLSCPGQTSISQDNGSVVQHFECTNGNALVRIWASNIVFENFEIRRSAGAAIQIGGSKVPVDGIVVRGNYVHAARNNGVTLYRVQHALIENNTVWDTGNYAPFKRPSALLDWGNGIGARASHYLIFRNNTIHDNWGDALLIDVNTGLSSDAIIDGNVFYNNYSSNGVYAHAVKNLIVINNLMYCPSGYHTPSHSSLTIAPTEGRFPEDINSENISVRGNMFYNCEKGGVVFWNTKAHTRTIENVDISDNVFVDEGNPVTLTNLDKKFFHNVLVDRNTIIKGDDAQRLLKGQNGRGRFPSGVAAGQVRPSWFQPMAGKDLQRPD